MTAKATKYLYKLLPEIFYVVVCKELGQHKDKTTTLRLKLRKLILLKKNNNKKDLKGLRPISLLTSFYKITSNLLTIRIREIITRTNILPLEMVAYSPGQSGSEATR